MWLFSTCVSLSCAGEKRILGSLKLPLWMLVNHVSTGNQTQVLCRSSTCSQLLSNSPLTDVCVCVYIIYIFTIYLSDYVLVSYVCIHMPLYECLWRPENVVKYPEARVIGYQPPDICPGIQTQVLFLRVETI